MHTPLSRTLEPLVAIASTEVSKRRSLPAAITVRLSRMCWCHWRSLGGQRHMLQAETMDSLPIITRESSLSYLSFPGQLAIILDIELSS